MRSYYLHLPNWILTDLSDCLATLRFARRLIIILGKVSPIWQEPMFRQESYRFVAGEIFGGVRHRKHIPFTVAAPLIGGKKTTNEKVWSSFIEK